MEKSKITSKDGEVIDIIVNTVCIYFEISDIFKTKSRLKKNTEARQFCFYFIKQFLPSISLSAIGQHCGGYNHSTLIYCIKTIKNLAVFDMRVKNDLLEINKQIKEYKKPQVKQEPTLMVLATKMWDDLYVQDKNPYTDFESYYSSLFDAHGNFIFT